MTITLKPNNTRTFEHVETDLGYEDLEVINNSVTGRRYITPEGKKYPSITTVLSILSRDHIQEWRARVGDEEANRISNKAATRGTKVHALAEHYIRNEPIDKSKLTPDLVQSFSQIKSVIDNRVGKIHAIEAPLYSDYLGVAGRVDCIAEFDGKLSVIDFKTSRKPKKRDWIQNYFIQETFYAIAWEERTTKPIVNLVTIISVDSDDVQVFIEHRDDYADRLVETIDEYKKEKHLRG